MYPVSLRYAPAVELREGIMRVLVCLHERRVAVGRDAACRLTEA